MTEHELCFLGYDYAWFRNPFQSKGPIHLHDRTAGTLTSHITGMHLIWMSVEEPDKQHIPCGLPVHCVDHTAPRGWWSRHGAIYEARETKSMRTKRCGRGGTANSEVRP